MHAGQRTRRGTAMKPPTGAASGTDCPAALMQTWLLGLCWGSAQPFGGAKSQYWVFELTRVKTHIALKGWKLQHQSRTMTAGSGQPAAAAHRTQPVSS